MAEDFVTKIDHIGFVGRGARFFRIALLLWTEAQRLCLWRRGLERVWCGSDWVPTAVDVNLMRADEMVKIEGSESAAHGEIGDIETVSIPQFPAEPLLLLMAGLSFCGE